MGYSKKYRAKGETRQNNTGNIKNKQQTSSVPQRGSAPSFFPLGRLLLFVCLLLLFVFFTLFPKGRINALIPNSSFTLTNPVQSNEFGAWLSPDGPMKRHFAPRSLAADVGRHTLRSPRQGQVAFFGYLSCLAASRQLRGSPTLQEGPLLKIRRLERLQSHLQGRRWTTAKGLWSLQVCLFLFFVTLAAAALPYSSSPH